MYETLKSLILNPEIETEINETLKFIYYEDYDIKGILNPETFISYCYDNNITLKEDFNKLLDLYLNNNYEIISETILNDNLKETIIYYFKILFNQYIDVLKIKNVWLTETFLNSSFNYCLNDIELLNFIHISIYLINIDVSNINISLLVSLYDVDETLYNNLLKLSDLKETYEVYYNKKEFVRCLNDYFELNIK